MENLLGVVLCGGESKRMGKDKGLLTINETPWAKVMADKLTGAGLPFVISVNQTQEQNYAGVFPRQQLVIDESGEKAPLIGLLSVHRKHPGKDLLVLACDMIDMELETLLFLTASYNSASDFEYYAYQNEGFIQPFCCIYTSRVLKMVNQNLQNDRLNSYSLYSLIKNGKTCLLPLTNFKSFKNYNTP